MYGWEQNAFNAGLYHRERTGFDSGERVVNDKEWKVENLVSEMFANRAFGRWCLGKKLIWVAGEESCNSAQACLSDCLGEGHDWEKYSQHWGLWRHCRVRRGGENTKPCLKQKRFFSLAIVTNPQTGKGREGDRMLSHRYNRIYFSNEIDHAWGCCFPSGLCSMIYWLSL